jgi:LEA14-like dessication related protein
VDYRRHNDRRNSLLAFSLRNSMESINRRFYPTFLALLSALLLSSCAVLSPSFQTPELEVTSVEPLPSSPGGDLRFRINLRVFNPNDTELALSGLYYTLRLSGHKVITGTSNNLPPIAAYGQDDIVVDATASLVGSLMAAVDLIGTRKDTVPYELEAKLGLRKSILPSITVRKKGELRLSQSR